IWASVAILLATSVGLVVAMSTPVRKTTGLSFVLNKTAREGGKLRDTLQSVYDTIHTYYKNPGAILQACLLTIPVHGSVIISALFAGWAFDLPIPWPYYFVCVPVIVLSASMPISPQGAGVMEFFAVLLTKPQGATVSQAFALALSIRVVQILWNLTGGIFVFRGGYSEPANLDDEDDDDDTPLPQSAVPAAA
ncbi:MAG: lysylphosphatidylglycerol synthase domain-containing protein, partial [Planctomycetota bacterium]